MLVEVLVEFTLGFPRNLIHIGSIQFSLALHSFLGFMLYFTIRLPLPCTQERLRLQAKARIIRMVKPKTKRKDLEAPQYVVDEWRTGNKNAIADLLKESNFCQDIFWEWFFHTIVCRYLLSNYIVGHYIYVIYIGVCHCRRPFSTRCKSWSGRNSLWNCWWTKGGFAKMSYEMSTAGPSSSLNKFVFVEMLLHVWETVYS